MLLSFCNNSKQFITGLCTPGDRKVLNQRVLLTEAGILIFPELLFTSRFSPTVEDFSSGSATQSLLKLLRVVCSPVEEIMIPPIVSLPSTC